LLGGKQWKEGNGQERRGDVVGGWNIRVSFHYYVGLDGEWILVGFSFGFGLVSDDEQVKCPSRQ
jgi:hypothetical protein